MTSGLGTLLRKANAWRGVVALAYHRVGEPSNSLFDRDVWSAASQTFDRQVRFLKKNFDVIGPGDLSAASQNARNRYALVTFDDGYRDNYEQAFPILKSHGVGAAFFVSTGFIDDPKPSWWDEIAWMTRSSKRSQLPQSQWLTSKIVFDEPDREKSVKALLGVYKSLPGGATGAFLDHLGEVSGSGRLPFFRISDTWMTWNMLREMKAAGMWIGGHTVNHPILARLNPDEQYQEIANCGQRIQAELGEPMKWFSYPRGKHDSFNADTRAGLKKAGVELAFSYYGGYRRFDDWDPHDIRRVAVDMDVNLHQFQAALTLPQVFA